MAYKASVSIPLIGQGPAPEEVQQIHQNANTYFQVWPVHPFPFGSPKQEPYWMGKTLIDEFAMEAMRHMDFRQFVPKKGDTAEAIKEKEQRLAAHARTCWTVASAMMGTRPLKGSKGEEG